MSRTLDDLDPRIRGKAFELLARCVEAGIMVMVIDTLRTPEEQAANVAKGVSKTLNSKHLPQPPAGKSLAIDICPYETYAAHGPDKLNWNINDPIWRRIGAIAEGLGLVWGGRFGIDPKDYQTRIGWDPGHCQYAGG